MQQLKPRKYPSSISKGVHREKKEVLKNASIRGMRAKKMEETVREGKERFKLLVSRAYQG